MHVAGDVKTRSQFKVLKWADGMTSLHLRVEMTLHKNKKQYSGSKASHLDSSTFARTRGR